MPNPFRSLGADIAEGLKSFGWFVSETTVQQRSSFWYGNRYAPSSRFDYGAEAGDLWRNNTVFACLNWIRRTFPEAPVAVAPIDGGEPDQKHALSRLLRRPNGSYGRSTLWGAVSLSYVVDGNAYLFKRRNGVGQVVELWYRPHWMVRPRRNPNSTNLIDYYEYSPPGAPKQRIAVEDVVHLRDGIDPDDEMRGLSSLKALLRTVVTDNQADNFSAAMLRNMGVPSAILTLKAGANPPSPDAAEKIKADIQARTSGDNVGKPLFVSGPMDVTFPEIALDGLALLNIKKLTQSDVSAAIGIPAVVVGLLVGLETSTAKASHADAREQAYESFIVPTHRSIAEDLDLQLLPDFGNPETEQVVWDYSDVAVLGEGVDAIHTRAREDYKAGLIDRWTAKERINEEPLPEDKGVYYGQASPSPGNSSALDEEDGTDDPDQTQTEPQAGGGRVAGQPVQLAGVARNGTGQ